MNGVLPMEEGGQMSFLFSIENMIKNKSMCVLLYSEAL